MNSTHTLGVIGAGNMGSALIRGSLTAKLFSPEQVIASRRNEGARLALGEELGIRTTGDNREVVAQSDLIILAIKPQGFRDLLLELDGCFHPGQTVISVAAGIALDTLERGVGPTVPVIRVMPNTPALVGEGVSPYCLGNAADATHGARVAELLSTVGDSMEVPEQWMNPITATSGSGPAYLFYLAEGMQKGAEELGLPADLAERLVHQTLFGAAKLLRESPEKAAELRQRVTSPGGTTAAAIAVFDEKGVNRAVVDALSAASRRGVELGATKD